MKLRLLLVPALVLLSLSGCATIDKITKPLSYETGVKVTQETLDGLVDKESTKTDVIAKIGQPARKADVMGVETWSYDYTYIPPLPGQKNISESSTFEFDKDGVLVNHYKSGLDPEKSVLSSFGI